MKKIEIKCKEKMKKCLEKDFRKVLPEVAEYFLSHYSFDKKFDFYDFASFFKITVATSQSTQMESYLTFLYEKSVHLYCDDFMIYQTLLESVFQTKDLQKIRTYYQIIMCHFKKEYQSTGSPYVPSPLYFYKLLDNEEYNELCKDLLLSEKVNLRIDDLMNIVEVVDSTKEHDFLRTLFENSDAMFRALIQDMNLPFDLFDILIRDKNSELIIYLLETYSEFLQYDDLFHTMCQVKECDISFLHHIFEKIKSEKYAKLPHFVDDENGINLLIHKGDEKLALTYMHMVELQNYANYVNHAMEKKMFEMVDYLCGSIQRIDLNFFHSIYFQEKIQYTTLFYESTDYEKLNTIFQKYGIEEKHPEITFIEDRDESCQICLDDESEDKMIECAHCHKRFHIYCIFEYMKSKQKEKVETEDQALQESGEVQIELYQEEEDEGEWEDEEGEESGEGGEGGEGEEEDKEKAGGEVEEEEDEESSIVRAYVGSRQIIEKNDVMCIYSKLYKELKCIHCRQLFSKE